jgi:uncharacterized protein
MAIAALLDGGADANARDAAGFTPLLLAAKHIQDDSIEPLLRAGADVHALDAAGNTPLHLGAPRLSPRALTALIDAGAEVGKRNHAGESALDRARAEQRDPRSLRVIERAAEGRPPLARPRELS